MPALVEMEGQMLAAQRDIGLCNAAFGTTGEYFLGIQRRSR